MRALDDRATRLFIVLAAFALIPLIYLMRTGITGYLGNTRAAQLREKAAQT